MKIYNSFIKSSLQKLILSDIAKLCEVQSSAFSFCTSTILLGIENYCLKKNQPVLINSSVNFGSSVIENTSLQPDINTPSIMSKFRLSSTITPKAYDLYLYPNLKTGLYKGKVIINLNVSEITNDITLHSKGLTIIKAEIDGEEASFKLDEEHQLLKLTKKSRKLVNLEEASLEIEFHGDMRKKLVGLYQSTYKDGDTLRPIATSKFEPTYARQAFPCFDEPNMKAAYTIHLWVPNEPNYIALSNYPQVGEEPYEDGKLIHFQESVSMSTYLACFIVSDFKFTQTSFQNKDTTIPFRVYATPQQLNKTKYAGEVGKKTIEYYIKYFDIPYPLPKLDMVAIPDFSSGAMEHWGLVTYRETALLYTPETHSAENQQRVLVVVAHELAHSWFGNLVTMDWWDNLWLNEGFASYIEYKGGDAAEPTFGLMEQFLVNELHPVLNLDAKISSHPIIQDVATPDQITEVFDTISYNKGASVLRMLERTVGEEKFRKGITNYLNKYKYGNAVTEQLWSEIQNVVGPSINVSEFMDSFTIQMGYPILNVTENDNEYTLTQKRFLSNPDDVKKQKPSKLGYKWTIPITYITDKGKSDVIWFDRSHDNLTIKKPQNVEWLKFNYDQVGYYRVNYPEKIWKELGLIMLNLTVSDRTHLLEEAFSIANSGQLSYEVPLELTKYLVNEINYAPWKVVSAKMQGLLRLLKGSKYEDLLKQHIIEILSPAYGKLSWVVGKNDSHLTKLTRVVVLKLACEVEYDDALKDASSQLDNWFKTRVAAPDLRDIIYKYGMKTADQEKWEKMLQIFKEETDANEKVKQMRGLAAVRNPSLLTKLIILAEDETYVRKQDYHNLLLMIADNPVGLPIVWDYIRENWKTLVSRFTLNDRYLGELIPGVTSSFLTQTKLSEMEVFFRTYPEAGAGTAARNRASETVKNNIVWLSKYKKVVEAWLQNKK